MSRAKRSTKRGEYHMVPTDHMVPADPITEQLSLDDPKPPENQDGSYWDRATGKVHPQPVVPPKKLHATTKRQDIWTDAGADYWDRTQEAGARRPAPPERPTPPPGPAAAVGVASEVPVAPMRMDEVQGGTVQGEAAEPAVSDGGSSGRAAHAKPRRRRWRLVPLGGAAAALAARLGGGGAFARVTGYGWECGMAIAGTLQTVTVADSHATASRTCTVVTP